MPRVDHVFAFIAEEEPGDEGVAAYRTEHHGWLPLLGADEKRVEALRPYAQAVANATGIPLRLARFSVREDLETIEPRKWR